MSIIPLILFSFFAVFFSCLVVCLQNTVYSVFSLILVFFNVFGVLLYLGTAEFLAVIVLMVYVGAVAILFLFTVMMLGTSNYPKAYKTVFLSSEFIAADKLFIFSLFLYLLFQGGGWFSLDTICDGILQEFVFTDTFQSLDLGLCVSYYSNDIYIFGSLLYTKYCGLFWLITLVLLVTLVGSLVLSLCYSAPRGHSDLVA